jgi:hypothetical protein
MSIRMRDLKKQNRFERDQIWSLSFRHFS